jgi:hypothetical protein
MKVILSLYRRLAALSKTTIARKVYAVFNLLVVTSSAILTVVWFLRNGLPDNFGWGFIVAILVVSYIGSVRWSLARITSTQSVIKYPGLSVIGILSLRKQQKAQLAVTVCMVGLVTYCLVAPVAHLPVSFPLAAVLALAAVFSILRQGIFDYRVRKRYYGGNAREAREIIRFILDNTEKIDWLDKGRPKPIITDEDLEQIQQSVLGALASRGMAKP